MGACVACSWLVESRVVVEKLSIVAVTRIVSPADSILSDSCVVLVETSEREPESDSLSIAALLDIWYDTTPDA